MNVYYYKLENLKDFAGHNFNMGCVGVEDHKLTDEEMLEQNKVELYKNTFAHESESYFVGYPIFNEKEGTLRPATRVELVEMGYQKLEDGEYLENREIKYKNRPNMYAEWNKEKCEWETNPNNLNEGETLDSEQNVIYVEPDNEHLAVPKWDKERKRWVEGGNSEEIKSKWYSKINSWKEKIRSNGFIYVDSNGKNHRQRVRDKDSVLLGNKIAALQDLQDTQKTVKDSGWYFSDGDSLTLGLGELIGLRLKGAIFTQAIFDIEAKLKKENPNLLLNMDYYTDKIDKSCDIKCWK